MTRHRKYKAEKKKENERHERAKNVIKSGKGKEIKDRQRKKSKEIIRQKFESPCELVLIFVYFIRLLLFV